MERRNRLAPETRAKQFGNFVLNLGIAALWLLKEPLRFFCGFLKDVGGLTEKMKAKRKRTVYVCQSCGYDSPKWFGRCPGCGAWNTMQEEILPPAEVESTKTRQSLADGSKPVPVGEVETEDLPRFLSGTAELDRVLGGGIIPGGVTLIVGDPGVGKSSLTLKVAANVARDGKKSLYVTGEESARQVRMRADRIDALAQNLLVVSETNLERIETHIENVAPDFLVIDSIQTMYRPDIESAPGSVSQVRECAANLLGIAKRRGIAAFIVGHVTKDGALAGPRVLEHIVDAVLYFEGDKGAEVRVLRAVKNRFGSTNEIGLFEMRDQGLIDVPDASRRFLSDRAPDSGSVIVPTVEGTRPLLVEAQALVAETPYAPPRRTADSVDVKRIQLLLAVLEKRVRLPIGACDVYVKVAGGIRIDEPAADLALSVAMASSFANRLPRAQAVIFGEVGLSGEVRAVGQAEARLREAARLGFTTAVLPKHNAEVLGKDSHLYGMELLGASTLGEALRLALPRTGKTYNAND